MPAMIEPETICIKCQHHLGAGVMWYDHFCTNPETVRTEGKDPVTGELCYYQFPSRSSFDSQFPLCRDMNLGNCPNYKEK